MSDIYTLSENYQMTKSVLSTELNWKQKKKKKKSLFTSNFCFNKKIGKAGLYKRTCMSGGPSSGMGCMLRRGGGVWCSLRGDCGRRGPRLEHVVLEVLEVLGVTCSSLTGSAAGHGSMVLTLASPTQKHITAQSQGEGYSIINNHF